MSHSSNVTIEELRIQSFRGIEGPLTVELNPTGVTLIYGENGSGKSSICDAIEFGLRGTISRRMADGQKERREVKNYSSTLKPTVDVRVGGRTVRRGFSKPPWDASGTLRPAGKDIVEGYATNPVVLRRHAVDAFWRVPQTSRLDVFWDYLKPPGVEWRTADDEVVLTDYERACRLIGSATRQLRQIVPDDYRSKPGARLWQPPTHLSAMDSVVTAVENVNKREGRPKRVTADQRRAISAYRTALAGEERLRSAASQASSRVRRDNGALIPLVEAAVDRAAEDYRALLGAAWLTGIQVQLDGRDLAIYLLRDRAERLAPSDVLSEAQLDLLAVFILVEMHIECAEKAGAARVLVLDDVFQSVDTPLRQKALDHLAKRLQGWQLILTVHDRLWLEVADRCFLEVGTSRELVELRDGGYGRTPVVQRVSTGPLRDLDAVIASRQSAVVVAATAGRAMERLAEQVSISLRVSVPRRAKDDFTIGDLWPPVEKRLRELNYWTSDLAALERTQFLRNKLGAHFSPWGDGISETECLDAAKSVRLAWRHLSCTVCGRMVKLEKNAVVRPCTHPQPA